MAEKNSAPVTHGQMHHILKALTDGTMQHVKRLEARIAELEQTTLRDEGVHVEGRAYGKGALVTYKSSPWVCRHPTCDKPGTSDHWRMVSRGAR